MKRTSYVRRTKVLAVTSVLGVLALAACGGVPANDPSGGAAPGGGDGDGGLADVEAQVEGLSADERQAKLVELTEAEGNVVNLYTSAGTEITEPLMAAWKEQFPDIRVDVYRAGSDTVQQRVLQEVEAGKPGFDVIETNGPQLEAIAREKALADYDSPLEDGLVDGSQNGPWTATRLLEFHVSWNTNLVAAGDEPTSWEDLADPRWQGKLVMEINDVDWFKTLYEYLRDEKGMAQADIDTMFAAMAHNASFVDGHSLMGQTLAAGQYAVASSNYLYVTLDLQRDGAPVAYEPTVEPMIVRPNGAGVSAAPLHPAGALLLMDWMLGDGQQVLKDLGLTPSRADLSSNEGVEEVFVDVGDYLDNLQEWTDRYQELAREGQIVTQ